MPESDYNEVCSVSVCGDPAIGTLGEDGPAVCDLHAGRWPFDLTTPPRETYSGKTICRWPGCGVGHYGLRLTLDHEKRAHELCGICGTFHVGLKAHARIHKETAPSST